MAGAGAKLFTSGSVLTADQVNTFLMDQSIMRFASTTARDAAFGGVDEPTLAEGMFAYTTDTNTLWYYTGSAWVVGSSGLVCVKAETAVSGVTSVNVDGVFTSTYTNYLINFNLAAAAGTGFTLAFRAGGVTTTTDYGRQSFTANDTALSGGRTTGAANLTLPNLRTNQSGMTVQVFSPQSAQFTSTIVTGLDIAGATTFFANTYWGLQLSSTQFDGFVITTTSNMTGTYSIYGYSKTV